MVEEEEEGVVAPARTAKLTMFLAMMARWLRAAAATTARMMPARLEPGLR
jgi:hypothetical protein